MLALAVALVACGADEPSAEARRADLVDQLAQDLQDETDGSLSSDEATCVAEALVDTLGEERFDDVVAAASGDGEPDIRDQVIDVFASCDALDPVRDGG